MRAPDWWRGISPRRRLLLTSVVLVVVVVAAVFVATASRGTATRTRDEPGAVLLVPGYGGAKGALDQLATRIRQDTGRDAEVLTLVGDGTGDLEAQAEVLAGAAEQAYQRGAPSVDVIGYSAGGVVARLWVAQGGQPRRVVTLGAPMHGTQLAAAGGLLVSGACPLACQQLAPGSALLRQLPPIPPGLPWLSIWTDRDEVVTPPDSARLDGAVNVPLQQACPGNQAAHGDLPTDPEAQALVVRALGTAPLAAPAECVSS
ncbi:lipase [Amycolatopsis sp. GM8]|uniref:lipase family alpha/beta hydrolase n=1 Tax=Amycolatopsis sp. GM8 TaxID=2896530 RepID=UPI001F27F939|nr:lipase [Amycolatopsis sp. GM8]